jgi:hypothetical protein
MPILLDVNANRPRALSMLNLGVAALARVREFHYQFLAGIPRSGDRSYPN